MDREAWWAAVHGVATSWIWLSDFTFTYRVFVKVLTWFGSSLTSCLSSLPHLAVFQPGLPLCCPLVPSPKLQFPYLGSSNALSLEGSSNRYLLGSPVTPVICQALDCGFGEGNGTPRQYSCLKNPMDGGAWKAAVHGVAEGRTRLSDFTFTFHFYALEKEMATHSSVLAWRISETGEPGGLLSMGLHRVRHDWSDLSDCGLCFSWLPR